MDFNGNINEVKMFTYLLVVDIFKTPPTTFGVLMVDFEGWGVQMTLSHPDG